MSGPLPKDPALRQRANKASTRAVLAADGGQKRRKPALPKLAGADGQPKAWHEQTRKWWRDVWRSPMAAEYLEADVHGLFRLAVLVDEFWQTGSRETAAEIRLQQQCFGLTPIDRRRLEWQVERVESATERRKAVVEPPPPPAEVIEDPRAVLRVLTG